MMSSVPDREGLALALVAVLVVVFLAAGAWFLYHPPPPAPSSSPSPSPAETRAAPSPATRPDAIAEVVYPGRDGSSVLDLLKQDHRVRLDSELLLFGSIVLEIDSMAAAPDEYWVFYRDTTRGDRPPEACTTRTGETIRWVLKQRR